MPRPKSLPAGLEETFEVNLGRVTDPEQAKERGSIRPAFFRLRLSEADAKPGDFLVEIWDQVDIDLDSSDGVLQTLITSKRDDLRDRAVKAADSLRAVRESERNTEQRIKKLLEPVA